MPETAHVLSERAYDPSCHVFCILAEHHGAVRPFFTWAETWGDAVECVQIWREWSGHD